MKIIKPQTMNKYLLKTNETLRLRVISEEEYNNLALHQKDLYEPAPEGWDESSLELPVEDKIKNTVDAIKNGELPEGIKVDTTDFYKHDVAGENPTPLTENPLSNSTVSESGHLTDNVSENGSDILNVKGE
jgi:hypothetical protein